VVALQSTGGTLSPEAERYRPQTPGKRAFWAERKKARKTKGAFRLFRGGGTERQAERYRPQTPGKRAFHPERQAEQKPKSVSAFRPSLSLGERADRNDGRNGCRNGTASAKFFGPSLARLGHHPHARRQTRSTEHAPSARQAFLAEDSTATTQKPAARSQNRSPGHLPCRRLEKRAYDSLCRFPPMPPSASPPNRCTRERNRVAIKRLRDLASQRSNLYSKPRGRNVGRRDVHHPRALLQQRRRDAGELIFLSPHA
jgi:hypothetical protein